MVQIGDLGSPVDVTKRIGADRPYPGGPNASVPGRAAEEALDPTQSLRAGTAPSGFVPGRRSRWAAARWQIAVEAGRQGSSVLLCPEGAAKLVRPGKRAEVTAPNNFATEARKASGTRVAELQREHV